MINSSKDDSKPEFLTYCSHWLSTRVLAFYHGLSETYLAKHLQALVKAQIIESLPGPKGGYRLMRQPEEITLLEIVEAIDGREPIFRCMEIRQRAPLPAGTETYRIPCGIHVAMACVDKAWREALRTQTIADIQAHYQQNVDAVRQKMSAEWIEERTRHTSEKA